MIITDVKNIEALRALPLTMELSRGILLFTNDEKAPVFSVTDIQWLSQYMDTVSFRQVQSKEEMLFEIAGIVMTDQPCTLVDLDVKVPARYEDRVEYVNTKPKKGSSRRNTSRPSKSTRVTTKSVKNDSGASEGQANDEKESDSTTE